MSTHGRRRQFENEEGRRGQKSQERDQRSEVLSTYH